MADPGSQMGSDAPALSQHLTEIERNKTFWDQKPLIREIYRRFYNRILARIDRSIPGRVVEIGSGIGNLKEHFPDAVSTDLFPNPWLDLACDAYRLPFSDASVSHLILFDVFHHLERPFAFFPEAARVLAPGGRLILFEPFISLASSPAYGLFHHEPVAFSQPIDYCPDPPVHVRYYAAQGNATRLFFRSVRSLQLPAGLRLIEAKAFGSFAYLFSGGLSKPALYPTRLAPLLHSLDAALSYFPRLFGARCLVVLEKS
jgi:SAM-dependent methyltransferase